MQLRESPLWLYCSSSLHKSLPSGGGLTWKVSRTPLQGGTLCLPVSWQGRQGTSSNSLPLWAVWSSVAWRCHLTLKKLFVVVWVFFLKYQQRFSSHCPAAGGRNDSGARVAARVDATGGWSDLKWVFITPFDGGTLVSDFPTAPALWGDLWEGRAGLAVHSQMPFLSF